VPIRDVPHQFAAHRPGQCGGMPSNFGIELRSLTHGCCERTNICRRWDARPIRAETRAKLVASIARGRRWLDEMVTGAVTSIEQIAARDKCSVRQVNMTISLAFLAPKLVQAAVNGRLPRGIGVARLRDAPAEWSRQHAMLGLIGLIPVVFKEQVRPAPGTGLESPETGSQNRRDRAPAVVRDRRPLV
jgi:hypothetical protein